ncbi:hypothetical protein [Runella sp.]|uniref:hypothetical protein n=1 Tax=Runella sp. TaxID=1960881 RepID=UPI003D0FE72B
MKKVSTVFLITFFISGVFTVKAQDAITLDPKTTTPTQAKLLLEGTGPVQSVYSDYMPLSERMGIKAIAAPTNGTKTTAIVGISDFRIGSPTQETGQATGVIGFANSKTISYGVQGIADAQTAGSTSVGVRGYASNVSSNATSYGGIFSSRREGSTNSLGYGIYATTYHNASGATGASYGGYFGALGLGTGAKTGVFSVVDHSGPTPAVSGIGFQTDISGIYSSQVIGLYTNITTGGSNSTFGAKLDYTGVAGNSATVYGLQSNVKGTGAASYRYGARFDVDGSTWNNSYGIYARSNIVSDPGAGNGLNSYGGYFIATGSSLNQFGIYATSDANLGPNIRYAGYFSGNVSVTGNLTKGSGTFKIDHPQDPENKFLYHSFVESPDMKNIYDGVVTTDVNGEVAVPLPAYFESLNKDFRYQLTGIGQFAQAIVSEEINNNQFRIKTDKPNVKVSWQVTGIRRDAYAEANRVVVEVEKQGKEKGKYLHPEVFGKDKAQSIERLHEAKSLNR